MYIFIFYMYNKQNTLLLYHPTTTNRGPNKFRKCAQIGILSAYLNPKSFQPTQFYRYLWQRRTIPIESKANSDQISRKWFVIVWLTTNSTCLLYYLRRYNYLTIDLKYIVSFEYIQTTVELNQENRLLCNRAASLNIKNRMR